MAGCDHNMGLPVVTRRQLLTGAAGQTLSVSTQAPIIEGSDTRRGDTDDVLLAWRAWRKAHARTLRMCRRQQRLESRLLETIGVPKVMLPARRGESAITAFSQAEIEAFFYDNSPSCQRAKTEFASHQARWNAGIVESGYSTVLQDEAAFEEHEHVLAARLFATPASSPAGILAKLDVLLRQAPFGSADDEFPWPQLRDLAKDVADLLPNQDSSAKPVSGQV